jgi:hypothetical protein
MLKRSLSVIMLSMTAPVAATSAAATDSTDFVHPGVFVSAPQLAYIREQIGSASGDPDVKAAYTKALASPFGSKAYVPHGPPASGVIECGSYDYPNHGCSDESTDSATAYLQALLFALNREPERAAIAAKVLDLYATNLTEYNNSNAPLQAAWSAMMYTKAAELLAHTNGSGWGQLQQTRLATMLSTVSLPLYYKGSGANGNWELSMLDAMAGLAVFTDNRTLFNHAVDFWRSRVPAYFWSGVAGDGAAPNACPRDHSVWNSSKCDGKTGQGCSGTYYGQVVLNGSTDGICQETCRDFGHLAMGMASSHYLAETALVQGIDLWKEQQVRFVAASELHAKLILSQPATAPSPAPAPSYFCGGLGLKLRQGKTFEVGFNALHNRLGHPMPHTEQYLKSRMRMQPDPSQDLIMVYETLTNGGHPPAPVMANT